MMQQKMLDLTIYTQPDALRQRSSGRHQETLRHFLEAQVVNSQRNVLALHPFKADEFGTGMACPSPAHIEAVNHLMAALQHRLLQQVQALEMAVGEERFDHVLKSKTRAGRMTKAAEQVWDYYLELFSQRQTQYADWLLATDRIARDCYQAVYSNLHNAQSIPSPPPFSYMETTRTPSTYRRGIRFSRIGRNLNPFPIVQLPYHRLINPWTLGAVHHEVAHNLQNDLGLWGVVPRQINQVLRAEGLPDGVSHVWSRWHKEIWADLAALLLGGPAVVTSLVDVLARSRRPTLHFNARGVHPIAYFRLLVNTQLMRRMGFSREARHHETLWRRLYPNPQNSSIPRELLGTFPQASALVVDVICYRPLQQLGGEALADVIQFAPTHHQQTLEAAERLARGIDPGIIPERFLVAAARQALERRFASPQVITTNFYRALTHR